MSETVSMQLFVTLAAVLILDGTLAYTVPECALKENHALCNLLRSADLQSMVLESMLKGNESLKDISEGVSLAKEAVRKALNTTDETRLLSALKRALHLQNAVLSQSRLPCETVDSCSKEQLSLLQTILLLVNAIMEGVENQKETIKRALEVFKSGPGNLTDRARKMAADVIAVI